MKMNDIMNQKGISISEERDWNCMNHHAEDGNPRWGWIRKEMVLDTATVGLEVNTWDQSIEIQFIKGSMPYATNLFWALLADRDVRRLIAEYQETTRKFPYKIWSKSGRSGCEDIFMTFGDKIGGFAKTETTQLCHISCVGKLNDGIDKMYIGDFVELVAFMGLTDDMNVKSLRKKAGVKYIRPKFAEEIADFDTTVTKIL